METETIESLKQYRRTLVAEIAAKRKQLAGVASRMRTILQDELDSLNDEDATLAGDASVGASASRPKRAAKERIGILPKGFWPYIVAKYLCDTRLISFKASGIISYLEERLGVPLSGDVRNRISAALASSGVLALVKRIGDGTYAIRENVTIAFLEETVSQKEREGIELSTLRAVCEKLAEHPRNGANGNENVSPGAGTPEANGGVQGLSV